MSETPTPAHEDDLIRLIKILTDAPVGGLSLEEVQDATTRTGEHWSLRTINDLMCELRPKVKCEKVKVGSKKVTRYTLRSN